MRILSSAEEAEAKKYLEISAKLASQATCARSRCGSIIVNNRTIIGRGYNSPPADREDQRRCAAAKDELHQKVTDKTCCIHAEQRAIIDALRKYPNLLAGSRLYFIRLDENGHKTFAGNPYCTICSKLALDVGIKEFVLWREDGICVYETPEYNLLSFQYKK